VELKPQEVCSLLVQKTDFLKSLLKRIDNPKFDDNRLYSSEILSILLQTVPENQIQFGKINGIEKLLVSLADYRSTDPATIEEEEFVENLFDCLCSCLLQNMNKSLFISSEGIELMLLMIKERKFCRKSSLRVLDYVLSNNADACQLFVEHLGLKTLLLL